MTETPPPLSPATRLGRAAALLSISWLVPGLGHVALRRPARGAVFFTLVAASALLGVWLDGHLFTPAGGQPLTMLGTLASMGMGVGYFLLRFGLGYAGDPQAPGYEYGTAFLLTAGLMNILLILDAWDIARGLKD